MATFKAGSWYESQEQVRLPLRNPAKGIAATSRSITVISSHHGARRRAYEDYLDLGRGRLSYVGHGRRGHQQLDHWNSLLPVACLTNSSVMVFLDCGDLFRPKRLLYAGEWTVEGWDYTKERGRWIFRFDLRPVHPDTIDILRYTFLHDSLLTQFDQALRRFARQREHLYTDYPFVMRTRDNIAAEIGEYYAIRHFNRALPNQALIRLRSGFRDVDAIQAGTGKAFAIKTTTRLGAASSSIWSSSLLETNKRRRPRFSIQIDQFIVVLLSLDLKPIFIGVVPARHIASLLRREGYQKSWKFLINKALLTHRKCRCVYRHESLLAGALD